ncbi:hypothetical protein BpHYR1_009500 [Brachionus plicatilis]|uniref:Uncharacterized protein n=1 Tax=Brachionus plicatilis TaxID=10195 RepID=A0A3M7QH04_BRAPC|nr:hypothetical protein BpHYR1_009500 [Brachionus plicatilis]
MDGEVLLDEERVDELACERRAVDGVRLRRFSERAFTAKGTDLGEILLGAAGAGLAVGLDSSSWMRRMQSARALFKHVSSSLCTLTFRSSCSRRSDVFSSSLARSVSTWKAN